MNDEILDIVLEYQEYEKASGETRIKYLESKIVAQATLQDMGYDAHTTRAVLKGLPGTLDFREFMAGSVASFNAREAVQSLLGMPITRQALGLAEIEAQAKWLADLDKLPPHERINQARARGIKL